MTNESMCGGTVVSTKQQQEELKEYISDTLAFIQTVKDFCDTEPEWTDKRESELKKMKDIKSRSDKKEVLEKELGEVLEDTLGGLEKLQHFLDAIEKLAVTSLFVFNPLDISFMPKKMSLESVLSLILCARSVSPYLLHFKRDDRAFFLPKLGILEVLDFQLHRYINITKCLCTEMRMDESFRLMFLFAGKHQCFIDTFGECRSRMIQFLADLEETAVQLDKMKKGSIISTVVGSSFGAIGGALSLTCLTLAPATAGLFLYLTFTGAGLGVTSGVNSLVTGITEHFVNKHHGQNANSIFENLMEDVQKVSDCLEQAASSKRPVPHVDEGKINFAAIKNTARSIYDGVSGNITVVKAMKNLKSDKVAKAAANIGLQNANGAGGFPKIATDLPDIGQLAQGTPLAMTKAARIGSIAKSVLFIGLDFLLIYQGSVSLAKGEQSRASRSIRCRSDLWNSEIQAWCKIHLLLCEGTKTFQRNLEILEQELLEESD
ncbi:hypothetical protein NFI96_004898 [Prochilodus magdalenae]|nr:hypothetical protein NFI96_004898 [Prochilodus magdalenae]